MCHSFGRCDCDDLDGEGRAGLRLVTEITGGMNDAIYAVGFHGVGEVAEVEEVALDHGYFVEQIVDEVGTRVEVVEDDVFASFAEIASHPGAYESRAAGYEDCDVGASVWCQSIWRSIVDGQQVLGVRDARGESPLTLHPLARGGGTCRMTTMFCEDMDRGRIAGRFFWYDRWLDFVRKHCADNASDYQ